MTGPLNTDYFSSVTAQVHECTSCEQLQAVASKVIPDLNAQVAAISAQVAALAPALALLTAPAANPGAIVTWITSLISNYLTPQLASYTKLGLQATALEAQVATLTAAITSKASSLPSCSISIL